MTTEIKDNAANILANKSALEEFAKENNISAEAARAVFERLVEKPEISPEIKEYIYSKERSEDFKGYIAGEEKGRQQGHEAGFAKGAALSALALGSLAVAFIMKNK